jgi:hypothetical protein
MAFERILFCIVLAILLSFENAASNLPENQQFTTGIGYVNTSSEEETVSETDLCTYAEPLMKVNWKLKNSTFLFFVFFILFIMLIFIKVTSPDCVRELATALFSSKNFMEQASKLNIVSGQFNFFLLDLIFLISLSIFLHGLYTDSHLLVIHRIFFYSFLFFFAKTALAFMIYPLFFSKERYNYHISTFLIYVRLLTILLLPLTFLITYVGFSYQEYLQNVLIFFLVISLFIPAIRTYIHLKKSKVYSLFYLILYLCVFEISFYLIYIQGIYLNF